MGYLLQALREYRESGRVAEEDAARRLLQKRLSTPTVDSLTIRDLLGRTEIPKQLSERDVGKLYADCQVALRATSGLLPS